MRTGRVKRQPRLHCLAGTAAPPPPLVGLPLCHSRLACQLLLSHSEAQGACRGFIALTFPQESTGLDESLQLCSWTEPCSPQVFLRQRGRGRGRAPSASSFRRLPCQESSAFSVGPPWSGAGSFSQTPPCPHTLGSAAPLSVPRQNRACLALACRWQARVEQATAARSGTQLLPLARKAGGGTSGHRRPR